MRTFLIPCDDCGTPVKSQRKRNRVCPECKRKRNAERNRRNYVPVDLRKTCTRCGVTYEAHQGKYCPDCRKVVAKEQIKAYAQRPDVKQARQKTHRERGYSRRALLAKYGLTPELYDHILEAQGGVCAICRKPHPQMCVDHCHESGRVRGILCGPCNRAIGHLGDTGEKVQRAANYLLQREGYYREMQEFIDSVQPPESA